MSIYIQKRGVWICKGVFVAICLMMAAWGHYPPAQAQDLKPDASVSAPTVYGLEIQSAVQQTRMDQISEKYDKIAIDVTRIELAASANANAIAGMQGENRIIFGLLGLLMSGSIVLQVRAKRGP